MLGDIVALKTDLDFKMTVHGFTKEGSLTADFDSIANQMVQYQEGHPLAQFVVCSYASIDINGFRTIKRTLFRIQELKKLTAD
jgi:hypothetical protein